MAETYDEQQDITITNFINSNGIERGEDYDDNVVTVAHTIIKDIANRNYNIDFIGMDEFSDWFENTIRDDYEILEDLPYGRTLQIRDLISDYINMEMGENFIREDDEYEADEDYDIISEDELNNIL